jgi:CRP/FNR family transcriptional regulator, anaerobic regulatory protein
MDTDKIVKGFEIIYPLSDALKEHLSTILQEREIPRKKYLLKAGHICRNIYFVESGLLRGYYAVESKEYSSQFMREGNVCMAPQSFFSQTVSQENIHAIEHSRLYGIEYRDLQDIYRNFPEFHFVMRAIIEDGYQLVDKCLSVVRMHSAYERYDWFKERFPELVKRVSAKYLSSYIGFSEVMLSNIKCGKK